MNRHGTETCYVNHGCRLPECREAHRKARARRALLFDSGRVSAWHPAAPVRAHIAYLHGLGWSNSAIAQASGMAHHVTLEVFTGKDRVHVQTARRILGVQGEPRLGMVDAELTHHRVRSLMAAGHRVRDIRAAAAIGNRDAWRWDQPTVRAGIAAKVRDAYSRLSRVDGGNPQTRAYAVRNGWPHPGEWDDPASLVWPAGTAWTPPADVVDEVAIARRIAGADIDLTDGERVELLRRMAAGGAADSEIGRVLRVSAKTVYRRRSELGIVSTFDQSRSFSLGAGRDPEAKEVWRANVTAVARERAAGAPAA